MHPAKSLDRGGATSDRRNKTLRTSTSRAFIHVMDEARLIRLGTGKAHHGAALYAPRFLVETLGFVLWHMPKPPHWVRPRVSPLISSSKQPELALHRSGTRVAAPNARACERLLGRRPIFLVGPARYDLERLVRQRPLQRLGFVPRRAHPNVALFIGRQDHRHCLRVDRLDYRVGRGRQEPIDQMRPGYRLRLGAAVTLELRPDTSERSKRPIIVQREPNDVLLLGLRVRLWRVLGEAVERHQAPVLRLQPSPPVW